jgi:hypothetical protein
MCFTDPFHQIFTGPARRDSLSMPDSARFGGGWYLIRSSSMFQGNHKPVEIDDGQIAQG